MMLRSILLSAMAAMSAMCASLQQVTNFNNSVAGVQMYIYVPDKLATKPAIVVALHPCGGSATSWFAGTRPTVQYADQLGFILIYGQTNKMSNCWGVHEPQSLTHGAGGDAGGIINMVKYALDKHGADPERVFVFGSSSGGMMTNVMAAVYPDVFAAGAAYSGAAHACFAGAQAATPFAANQTCAQGLTHTPEEWGRFVRNSYPDYATGKKKYPRMQIYHGEADSLVRPQCAIEAMKQWSNVFGIESTRNVTGVPSAQYTQWIWGDGTQLQGFMGKGVGHTAPVNDQLMLRFFGLLT